MGRIYKYAFEMSSGGMSYMPSFVKIGSGTQKLVGEYTYTQTAWRLRKHILFFQNKESGQKIDCEDFNWIELSQDTVHGSVLWWCAAVKV
jgi:hypothetical protein